MEQILRNFSHQVRESLAIARSVKLKSAKGIDKVLFCGMGGSAIGGDVIREAGFREAAVPFFVNRFFEIPKWVDSNTLVILSSHSGNTREVLDAYQSSKKFRPRYLIVTSGGKLGQIAKKNRLECIRIPGGLPPRCAIAYLTTPLLTALRNSGLAKINLKDFEETLRVSRKPDRAEARKLAKQIKGRTVHFYGIDGPMNPVVSRWRAQLAENAKTLSSGFLIPEMFHNEVEGWKHPVSGIKKSTAVFFVDREDPEWLKKKRRAAVRILKQNGGRCAEIRSRGKSRLARIFSMIQLGDWVSFELAKILRVDPLTIPSITAIKTVGTTR